jgi:hypothetical protein
VRCEAFLSGRVSVRRLNENAASSTSSSRRTSARAATATGQQQLPGGRPPRATMRVVSKCSAEEAARIVSDATDPVLFRGMLEGWGAASWSPTTLARDHGDVHTLFRLHRRPGAGQLQVPATTTPEEKEGGGGAAEGSHGGGVPRSAKRPRLAAAARPAQARVQPVEASSTGVHQCSSNSSWGVADPRIIWEGDCEYRHASFAQFNAWASAQSSEGKQVARGGIESDGTPEVDASLCGALAAFSPTETFAYADYKYMHQLFPRAGAGDDPLAAVDWGRFGQRADGGDSTLWLGSRGAWTQCHQDSYGCNLVAQLHGEKRWRLW